MKITVNRRLSEIDMRNLESDDLDKKEHIENQMRNVLALGLTRNIQAYLPLTKEKFLHGEVWSSEIVILSKAQYKQIGKLISRIGNLAQFGIDSEIAETLTREIADIFNSKTLESKENA